jgi:H+-transporting ATPase
VTEYLISTEEAKDKKAEDLFLALKSTRDGLSNSEAKSRFEKCGPNAIEEAKDSLLLKFLGYFWGPIPWMIEIAAVLSLVVQHWADFFIILTLLLVNGLVDFFEEYQAGNAIKALKKKLALRSLVKRDGQWMERDASLLVPGDIIRICLGQIIPADAKLIEGDYLSVDQSALTGESLPVAKKVEDVIFSGSIANQGEMLALVTSTGKNTFFGKTAKLVEKAKPISHFQKAILQIGDYLIYLSLILAFLLIVVQLARGTPLLELAQFVLILVVASIPVAMPAVLSVTMALGALKLAKMKAIVTKLESIEEMAGIDILCCDKTGTLTQNLLTLGDPIIFENIDEQTMVMCAALASKAESHDLIDLAVMRGIKNPKVLESYIQTKFVPFDPISKKTEAVIQDTDGKTFYVTKGAPQVILSLCHPEPSFEKKVQEMIQQLGEKGYRTLGVARSVDRKRWEFLGLLPLSDPLREDSAATIANANDYGIQVKMVTGDNIAIANEIAKQLHLPAHIDSAEKLFSESLPLAEAEKIKRINASGGFAQVFPEHKYEIVKILQRQGHIVGMTGDGVNDSPALKQAEVGIAVSGATDAARAAASLVLLESGISVIIKAIEEARRIFERMNSYAIYRITETIRIMLFMVACILIYNFYPVTALMIILLALLNDIPIMAIAYDNTVLNPEPVRWQMRKVLTIATTLGCIGIIETFLLLIIFKDWFLLNLQQLQSLIFLKLSVAGHLTLFIARTKQAFFTRPYPSMILFSAITTTQIIAALIVGFGVFVTAVPWSYIGFVWLYCFAWMFVEDGAKIFLYKHL